MMLLKTLQQSTRLLHHCCGHSKVTKVTNLVNHVPHVKKTLESLLFRVKVVIMLVRGGGGGEVVGWGRKGRSGGREWRDGLAFGTWDDFFPFSSSGTDGEPQLPRCLLGGHLEEQGLESTYGAGVHQVLNCFSSIL